MNHYQSTSSNRSLTKRKPPQILGQTVTKFGPSPHSQSPQNQSNEQFMKTQTHMKPQDLHLTKIVEGPGRKLGANPSSNSPKNQVSGQSKLFLKDFHQQHQQLFPQQNMASQSATQQIVEYKQISTKSPTGSSSQGKHTKIIFTSPHQSKLQNTSQNSKKNSPDSSTQTANIKSSDQSANIISLINRKKMNDAKKQYLNLNQNNSNNSNLDKRPVLQQNLVYTEYMNIKSRSPQNIQGKSNQINLASQQQLLFANGSNSNQSSHQTSPLGLKVSHNQHSRNNILSKFTTNPIQSLQKKQSGSNFMAYRTNTPGGISSPLQQRPKSKQNMFIVKDQSNTAKQSQISGKESSLAQQNQLLLPFSGASVGLKQESASDDLLEDQLCQDSNDNDGGMFSDEDGSNQTLSQKSTKSYNNPQKQMKDQARLLWFAVENGDKLQVLKLLQNPNQVQVSMSINSTNTDDWGLLHVASSEGHVQLVEILIEYGAQIDARTKNFRTPLHISCIRGNFGVIQTLLMQGADQDAKDLDGNTPAHFCAEYGHSDCLRFLLTKHPTLFAKNSEGKSPIDVAVNHEILQIFEQYINSVKNYLYKKPVDQSKPINLENKNLNNDSHNSSESNNSLNQKGKFQVDDATLESKATSKQIRISDSLSQPLKSAQPQEEQMRNLGDNPKLKSEGDMNFQSMYSGSTQQPQTFSQVSQDEKVGPNYFLPIKMLGSGSFGEVYLVKEKRNNNLFAMKVLSKQKIMGQNLVRYAKTERDVLSYTKHPFIVNLNYAFQTKSKLFLILDFCPGGDLGKVLQKVRKFNEETARIYAAEILLALEDLHKRDIIYRDLKPDNVVLDEEGHALLTDFGLSKEGVLEGAYGAKSFCGSVAYLAPEMLRKSGHGKSVDWYLLGVLLYEMVVGCPPYFSPQKNELFNNIQRGVLKIPASLSEQCKLLIVSLLNRNPSKRLGAGPSGSEDIKKHPFFEGIDWTDVIQRKLVPPKPEIATKYLQNVSTFTECPDEVLLKVFDDYQDNESKEIFENKTVLGWSFVNNSSNSQSSEDNKYYQT